MMLPSHKWEDAIWPSKPCTGFFLAANKYHFCVIARTDEGQDKIVYESQNKDVAKQFKQAAIQLLSKNRKLGISVDIFDIALLIRNKNWFKKNLLQQ